MAWARRYAAANRQQIGMNIGTILVATIGATTDHRMPTGSTMLSAPVTY
jgi:hypothetical protein